MAYHDYRNPRQNNRPAPQTTVTPLHPPMELPEEYVEAAEKVMQNGNFKISTSKIRGFLSIANDIYNVESRRKEETLAKESLDKLNMLRVRILYEAGRDKNNVKPFVEESRIINYLKSIGDSRQKFIRFCRYLEALVAYHRFFSESE